MAAKYAIAAGGNWDDDTTWSTSSGGANDTTKPTAADDVFIDASSGQVTINAAAVCRSINCTGYTGTLTHNAAITLSIGDATAGASNIALKFVAGMTYTLGNATSSALNFITTSATVQTVDFAGKTTGDVGFNATSNGSWQYTGGHVTGSTATITLTKGTLDINGQTCSWGKFNSSNSNTRTLTLGAAAITITGATSNTWDMNATTGLTITANTATITFTGANSAIRVSNFSLNGASVVASNSGNFNVNGAGGPTVLANFTRTGTAAKTDSLSFNLDLTCSGTFTCNGNSATNRVLVQSNTVGTARTITAATVSVTNSDFQDITGAGAGSWDLSAVTGLSGDCGGNSNITFTTGATQTATMSTNQNWSTAGIWTSRVPLPQDNVSLASVTGGTLTADMPRLGKSIDWTGATGSPTWNINTYTGIYGSLTLISGMSLTTGYAGFSFRGRGTHTITSAGKAIPKEIRIIAVSGTYSLSDAFDTDGNVFIHEAGVFNTNGFNITCLRFESPNNYTRSGNLSTSTISLTSTEGGNVMSLGSNASLTMSSATFVIANASANARTFPGGNFTYGTLTYTVAGSTGKLTLTGSNSFAAINFSDVTNARTLEFTASTTTTIRNENGFNVQGTSGKLMTIQSATAASHTLSSTEQQVCDYLSISRSTSQGGGDWYAGDNSTDGGNNVGWLFEALPAGAELTVVTADMDEYEKAELQQNLSSTNYSLYDLRQMYYGSQGHTKISSLDNIRAFLISATSLPSVTTTNDLWRAYAISRGVTNQMSLSDMLKQLFNDYGVQ